jgi:hypothetical protein
MKGLRIILAAGLAMLLGIPAAALVPRSVFIENVSATW